MSEEAVRQTRSQKRALERDATPQSIEPSTADSDIKKPKLDPPEPTAQAQTKPTSKPVLAEDGQSETRDRSEDGKDQEEGQSRSPIPLVSPLASLPAKDDQARTQKQNTAEPSSDNRTDNNDRASKVRTEPAMDTRSKARLTDPKASGGMLAAGEVKATIKVEVQTGEQPVDMSTSRG